MSSIPSCEPGKYRLGSPLARLAGLLALIVGSVFPAHLIQAQNGFNPDLGGLFQQAQAASQQGKYARSEELYRRILSYDPEVLPARVNLGLACYWQHKNREAVTQLERALRSSPREYSALLFLGLASIDLGQYDRAREALLRAAQVKDMDPLLFWAQGSLAMIHSDANAAVPFLERAVALDPNNSRTVWLLGQAYTRLAYSEPEKPAVPADYASLVGKSLRWIEQREPNSALSHVFKGDVLAARKLTSEALAEYELAVKTDPNWPDIHLMKGSLLALLGRWDDALRELRLQLRSSPEDTRAMVEIGSVYSRAGNPRAALPFLREAISRDQDNYEAQFRLGEAYLKSSDQARAIFHLERATQLKPEKSEPYYLLFRAYQEAGEPEKATRALKQFEHLKKASSPTGIAQ